MLVDVGHGGYRIPTGSCAYEIGHGGRSRGGFVGQRGAASVRASKGWASSVRTSGTAKGSGACIGLGGGFCTGRAWLGVEQDGLGHRGGFILCYYDAAVAREVEVNLGGGAVVGRARGQRGLVERVRLAIKMVQCARVWIEEMPGVRVFGGRVEGRIVGGRRRRRRVGGAGCLAAAEELTEHVCHGAHAAMERRLCR